jgi:hypothetical protein
MDDAASLIGGWALAVREGGGPQEASVCLTKEGLLASGWKGLAGAVCSFVECN